MVFLVKMKGDYYRYMAEYSQKEDKKEAASRAFGCYSEALSLANITKGIKLTVSEVNPIRLGLLLNFSIFYYEIMQNKNKAL